MNELEGFEARFHAHFTRDANARVNLGVEERLGELPDPSLAEADACVAEARALLAGLEGVARSGLDFDAALDLDLARLMLEREIHHETHTWNGRRHREQAPSAGDDIGGGIFLLLANDPRPDEERLADITARLERAPDYLRASLARLDSPVERWREMDLEKVGELPELFETLVGWARETSWSDASRLSKACESAREALIGYAEGLRGLETTSQLHVGDATARRIVALRGIDLSFEALHAMARDFLAENRARVEALRRTLAEKYDQPPDIDVPALQSFLAGHFALEVPAGELERVLDFYEEERERVLRFIRERDLFPIPPDQDMKILRTPGFMTPSIPAGAMMSPPPFRSGVRTSLIYLTLSEELLAEHTRLSIPGMMIHEGIPGHHLQLASAAGHPSLMRRHVEAMDQAEGWTTMLEDSMLDAGYAGELRDEVRFSTQLDIARIGARVAIDLFFMTGDRGYLEVGVDCDLSPDDPFEAAGNLLQAVTGFVPGRVQAELNWYSQERGYPLSYLTGNRLVWELKRDMEARQAGRLEEEDLDRLFHRVFLEAGNMPVRFLRRVFAEQGLC